MEQLEQDIKLVNEHLETVCEYFHQQKSKQGYDELILLIDSLNSVIEGIEAGQNELLTDKKRMLLEGLVAAEEALRYKDTVLLADILLYDIKPVISDISDILK